jgi:ATP-dependent DNA helicase RecG
VSPAEIEARLRTGEDSATEFKSARAERDDLEKALCAFANSGGGDLFVGIEDDGTISGVGTLADVDHLQRDLAQRLRDRISPPLRARLITVELQGMLVLVARIPAFLPERPFRSKSGRYFVRDGASSREARPDELKRVLLSGANHYFDEEPIADATAADLDDLAIRTFFAEAYPNVSPLQFERYLRALHALDRFGVPTVTGVLLFGRDPQAFLLDAYVSVVRFQGTEVRSTFAAQELRGRLVDQLDAAVTFLSMHHPRPSEVVGLERIEHGVPAEIWREAMANALAHRDYQAASQTRVFVFDDRVEVINPGMLLNQLTLDGLRLGVTQRRNPHIAAALARRHRRENAGVGIPDMIAALAERGLPEPELKAESGEFRLTIWTRAREQ